MKHRRSIDLRPATSIQTLASLMEWDRVGGYCVKCQREGWLDKWALERRFGKYASLDQIAIHITCSVCGNKSGNRCFLGMMPR